MTLELAVVPNGKGPAEARSLKSRLSLLRLAVGFSRNLHRVHIPPKFSEMREKVPQLDPTNWVSEHGETLYAYAMSRLKKADAAEDAVQETLLAALRNLERLPPHGDVGPWLMGILKKKVVDRHRKDHRTSTADFDPIVDNLFDDKGRWTATAQATDPLRLDSLEQSEFMGILRQCLKGLPPKQAAVFVGREVKEQNSDDLCKELGISSTNLWVLMHRARLRLAECLRTRWAMENA